MSVDGETWLTSFLEYRNARTTFYEQARRSMGIAPARIALHSAWLETKNGAPIEIDETQAEIYGAGMALLH